MYMTAKLSILLLSLSAATAVAQTGVVHSGSLPGIARLPSGWTSSLAVQPDGTFWCLVHESGTAAQPTTPYLRLFASPDQGATWTLRGSVPTGGPGRGTLVADRGCDLLHVAWHATAGGAVANLYYQAFDTAAGSFVGVPELLLTGTITDDQYYPNEIAITAQGTLGISFNTHRAPLLAGFGAWSGGLFVRRATDTAFQGPFRLNTDTYGMLANLCAVGEVFHACFRTNTGGYGIRYRAFDATTMQFTSAGDVPLYGAAQGGMRSTNVSDIAGDGQDNIYVLYSVGPPNPAGGALEVAFATASTGYSTWTTTLVEADTGLQAGNVSYQHYALARGDNGVVYAVFAKVSESYQNVYLRVLAPNPGGGGVQVLPDPATTPAVPLLLSTEADTFQRVDGLLDGAVNSALLVAYSGVPASRPTGLVGFQRLGTAASSLEWGVACQGSLAAAPRLASQSLPQAGTTFAWRVGAAPTAAPGVIFAAFDCLRPPLDLSSLGFTGCTMVVNPLQTSNFFIADAAGAASFQLPIPSGLGGFTVHFGALILAAGANPGGAVVSNMLALQVD